MEYPQIIQGGMGVAVSGWKLAQAVAKKGQLGVVSGTALDTVLARRLQLGDVGGHMAEALSHFPFKDVVERIMGRHYIPGGKAPDDPFKSKPMPTLSAGRAYFDLTVAANFVEVWLAKQGHKGVVGINLLEKIQLPTLPSLYGAMLAGVDVVLMGAGIPRSIPGALDSLAAGSLAEIPLSVSGGSAKAVFDPAMYGKAELKRPEFLAIVSSDLLATILARKCTPPVDGFVVEGWTAGGHNAPPRGGSALSEEGEPVYGERDVPDLNKIRDLGLPFFLAGGFASREMLDEALSHGASGIQVGTAFAFCEESGVTPEIKREVVLRALSGSGRVFTSPKASPTGFPFKVLNLPGSLAESEVYEKRERICDLGYLREAYQEEDGKIGFRCPAEPVEDYVRKGGSVEATHDRMCVCNGLVATVGMGQVRNGTPESCLITAGDDVVNLARCIKDGQESYTAADVIDSILQTSR